MYVTAAAAAQFFLPFFLFLLNLSVFRRCRCCHHHRLSVKIGSELESRDGWMDLLNEEIDQLQQGSRNGRDRENARFYTVAHLI